MAAEPVADTVSEAAEAVSASPEVIPVPADEPAFEYVPPVVEAPEPPTVSEMPSVDSAIPNQTVQDTQPAFQQPQYQQQPQFQQQPYQQQPQFQQQPYQPQPQFQQQPYQPPYQQPYQQPQNQQPYQQPGVSSQPYYQYAPVNVNQNTTDGFAVASLICAIVGLISCCTVVPSLLGIIFGAVSKAKNDGTRPTGVSTAGLVVGIIGLILNILVVLGMIYAD